MFVHYITCNIVFYHQHNTGVELIKGKSHAEATEMAEKTHNSFRLIYFLAEKGLYLAPQHNHPCQPYYSMLFTQKPFSLTAGFNDYEPN